MDLIVEDGCEAAVLDVNLGDHSSSGAARELLVRKIPIVVLTGYRIGDLPSDYRAAPKILKPPDMEGLLALVKSMIGEPSPAMPGNDAIATMMPGTSPPDQT